MRARAGGRPVGKRPLGAALLGHSAGTRRSTLAPPEGREEGQQQHAMWPRYRRSAESVRDVDGIGGTSSFSGPVLRTGRACHGCDGGLPPGRETGLF